MAEELVAFLLGIIQGIAEFLPISSSGHLEIGKILMDKCGTTGEDDLLFSVVVHLATALSTIVVFRKDIIDIFSGALKKDKKQLSFMLYIILSMIPAAIIGLLFKDEITNTFACNSAAVGGALIFTALVLFLSEKIHWKEGKLNSLKALLVGLAQAIALIPGISRSGSTIGASLMLGISKEQAARFSFLMVLPLIFGLAGKEFLEYKNLLDGGGASTFSGLSLFIGFGAAFITGWFACTWMIKLVKRSKLTHFAVYCLIAGLISIFV